MNPEQSGDRDFEVLHVLRCIGFTSEDRVADVAGLEPDDTVASLESLTYHGLVSHETGVFGGWGITDSGRNKDAEWIAAELNAGGARSSVEKGYQAFLTLNPRLLKVCHDWQMQGVGGAHFLNDHTDAAYDAKVIGRLAQVDGSLQPILDDLSALLPRFSRYRTRLTHALDRLLGGEQTYFTDGVDSYHAVWFHLHEDLLSTLGIPRSLDS